MKTVSIEHQPSGRSVMMMESNQLAADRQQGVEEEKEMSEGDYEEVYNILNTPFTMEYNMSYSTVTQTAM